MFHNPSDKFAEEREGGIRDDEIHFFEQFLDFLATEIAVTFHFGSHDVGFFDLAVAVRVAFEDILHALAALVVAGADELLQAVADEVLREVLGEVAPSRVVTRAEDGLATENIRVAVIVGVHFAFNVRDYGVKFVILGGLGLVEVCVGHICSPIKGSFDGLAI